MLVLDQIEKGGEKNVEDKKRKQRKKMISTRVTKNTMTQINVLSNLLDISYTDVIAIAIDRLYIQEAILDFLLQQGKETS